MLKTIVYLVATLIGVGYALQTPLWGGVLVILTYLCNPDLVASELSGIRYQLLAAGALVISLLFHSRPNDGIGTEGRWIFGLLWAYVAVSLLTAFWAVHSSNMAVEWVYDFSKTILVVSLFPLAIRTERGMSIVVWACLIGASHAAFMHVVGTRIGWAPPSVGQPGHDSGVLVEYQGMTMAFFVPLFVVQGFYAENKYSRLFCWLSLPIVLDSIVNTYNRTVFIAILLEVSLVFVFLPWRVVWRLLPILAFAGALFLAVFTPDTYWERMSTIKTPTEEGSANSRFVIAEASLAMFQQYPLGVGYRNYPDVSPRFLEEKYLTLTEGGALKRAAHNTYFSVLCETGILGFALWAGAVVGTMWLFRRLRKTMDGKCPAPLSTYALGFEIGLYGWMIGGMTNSFHECDPAYWFMAFAVILTRLNKRKCRHEQKLEVDAERAEQGFTCLDLEGVPVAGYVRADGITTAYGQCDRSSSRSHGG